MLRVGLVARGDCRDVYRSGGGGLAWVAHSYRCFVGWAAPKGGLSEGYNVVVDTCSTEVSIYSN